MFTSDINILIGLNFETHIFHQKIKDLFDKLKSEYETYLILNSVEIGFKRKILDWSMNAVSILISTTHKVKSSGGILTIVDFNKKVEEELEKNIKDLSKIDKTIDIERVREKINEIVAKYTYSDLLNSDNEKNMMKEFYLGKEEYVKPIFDKLKETLKSFFKIKKAKLGEDIDIRSLVRKHFEKEGIRDPKDDEKIAEDLIINSDVYGKLKMFLTADNNFANILKNIIKERVIKIDIKLLN